jgi:2-phosphoglycerate kinase
MIYLIGGAPRCGKTTIAKQLSKKLRISWKEKHGKLFPKAIMRKKTKLSNDLLYLKYSTKEIVNAYTLQSKTSWTAIEVLVSCYDYEGHDIIIEGHQIHPQLINDLQKKYKELKGIIVVKSDLKTIVSDALQSKAKNDWFLTRTKNAITFEKIGMMIKKYSDYFIKESKRYKIEVVNMDNNFKKQINKVVNYLKI